MRLTTIHVGVPLDPHEGKSEMGLGVGVLFVSSPDSLGIPFQNGHDEVGST